MFVHYVWSSFWSLPCKAELVFSEMLEQGIEPNRKGFGSMAEETIVKGSLNEDWSNCKGPSVHVQFRLIYKQHTNSQQFIYIEIPECQCSLDLIYEVQKGFGTPMMHGHYCYSATTTCHCFWGKMIEAAASTGNLSAAEDWFRPQGQRASLFAFAQETVGRIVRAPGSTSFHLHTSPTSIHFHSLPFVQDLVILLFLALQAKCGTLRRRGWPA